MAQSNRSKVYKGMSAQTFVTIVMGVLGILYFAIMSRLLSKEDFGYFAIITAVTSVLTSLSEAGLGSAVIQYKNADNYYIQTAWTLSLILGIFFCLFLFLSASFMSNLMVSSDILSNGFKIMSFSLFFYAINGVGRAVIIRKLKFLQYGIFDIVAYIFSSLIGIVMALKNCGFYSVVVAMLLHQAFLGLQVLYVNRAIISFKIRKIYIKQIVSFGGWLTGSVIIRNITNQADKLITTHWIPVAQLGAYNRPTGLITQITGNVYGIFDIILFPILSSINDNPEKIVSAYQKSTNLIVLFSVILAASFILGAEFIIQLFLGNDWLYLSDIFNIVSLTIIFLSYDKIADCFFRSLGLVQRYFWVRVFILAFTCIWMYFSCQYGIKGLALGLLLSKLTSNILKVLFLSHHLKINRMLFYFEIIKSLIVPFVMFLFCYIIKLYIPYGSFISVCLFLIAVTIIAIVRPTLYGDIFINNVYEVVKSKRYMHRIP